MEKSIMNWELEPQKVFTASPIIPVIVIERLEDALPMAMALSDGGLSGIRLCRNCQWYLDAG